MVGLIKGMESLSLEDKLMDMPLSFVPGKIPDDIIKDVFFECVTGAEWGALVLVSKSWCTIASNTELWKKIFDREGLRYFDEVKCQKYRGNPGKVPHISLPRAYGYFNSDCKLFPGRKVKEMHKLQLFYKEIDEMPITLNHAGILAQHPKKGSEGIAACFSEDCQKKAFKVYGEVPLDESFWAFVTVKPFQIGESLTHKQAELKLTADHPQYRLHKAVERSIANFDNVVEKGEYLDKSYVRCKESLKKHVFTKEMRKDGSKQGLRGTRLVVCEDEYAVGSLHVHNSFDYGYPISFALLRKF